MTIILEVLFHSTIATLSDFGLFPDNTKKDFFVVPHEIIIYFFMTSRLQITNVFFVIILSSKANK